MEREGTIRTNPETGAKEFQAPNGQWHDLSVADMAHKEDVVRWWNRKGKYYGEKAPEVRRWMENPDNYYLEHLSKNRSDGAKLGQTPEGRYDPPAPR